MAVIQMEREATLCVRILIQLHLLVAVVHLMVGGLHHTSTGYLVSVKGVDVVTMKGAPATQGYRNVGSQLIVNYVASYQWSITAKNWQIVKDSSFNTDGSRPEFDCAKPNGGLDKSLARIQPQPGGADLGIVSCWSKRSRTSRNVVCVVGGKGVEYGVVHA